MLKEYSGVIPGVEAVMIQFRNILFFYMNKFSKTFYAKIIKLLIRYLIIGIALFIVISFFSVLLLKWIDPITSSIIVQRQVSSLFKNGSISMEFDWVNYDDISPHMKLAVIAAEDQNFPLHFGFDMEQIEKAIEQNKRGRRMRGASTITQQLSKNLFLWEGKSFVRKGLEAYFTILMESILSKARILEIYLNMIETGNMVFGVGAASRIYFRKNASMLSASDSALIAAILPNPLKRSAKYPSDYTLRRRNWILSQMNSLGGVKYIENL